MDLGKTQEGRNAILHSNHVSLYIGMYVDGSISKTSWSIIDVNVHSVIVTNVDPDLNRVLYGNC